jgi:hypothetical protein
MANNFPNILPTLNLDMVNGIYVDPRVTFTRAGTRTYYGQEVVKAEENLVLYSQEFDNAYWTKLNTTLTANSAAAPDGATTADLFYPSSTGVDRIVWRATSIGAAASTQYTISVYAKASGINFLYFGTFSGGTTAANLAFFDLGTGAVGQTGALFSSASITAVGNGWYRCVATATTATTAMNPLIGVSDASGNTTATASGTDGILIWQAQLEQRSFATAPTVTTTQPITRYQRQLKTAAANEWPREFDPVTGECLGRSVWESRTNLLTRSEEFDNASWIKTRSSILANQIIAPDGTLTADKLIENTDNNSHIIQVAFSPLASTSYTYSAYIKASERTFALIQLNIGGTNTFAIVNLTTGAVGSVTGAGVVSTTATGNGWYRVSISAATTTTASGNVFIYTAQDATTFSYTGDGTSGIYIWGAQLETGAFATPYIPTVAAQVTRVADSAVMTGVNFSSWFNFEQGTLFVDAAPSSSASVSFLRAASISGLLQADEIFINKNLQTTRAQVFANNATQANFTFSDWTDTSYRKMSLSYKFNDFIGVVNGGSAQTDTSGIIPVVDRLGIGSFQGTSTGGFWNGYIKRLTYYPQALTSANHQAVTR